MSPRKVYGLASNPARDVETLRERYDATRFDFYSPEEVSALPITDGWVACVCCQVPPAREA